MATIQNQVQLMLFSVKLHSIKVYLKERGKFDNDKYGLSEKNHFINITFLRGE